MQETSVLLDMYPIESPPAETEHRNGDAFGFGQRFVKHREQAATNHSGNRVSLLDGHASQRVHDPWWQGLAGIAGAIGAGGFNGFIFGSVAHGKSKKADSRN
jgi:hypothetical protein